MVTFFPVFAVKTEIPVEVKRRRFRLTRRGDYEAGKKIVGIALTMGLIAALAISLTPQSAHGSGSAPVTVVNTPLPVQGTLNAVVTGSVNANITNTPSVNANITNTPSVNVSGPVTLATNSAVLSTPALPANPFVFYSHVGGGVCPLPCTVRVFGPAPSTTRLAIASTIHSSQLNLAADTIYIDDCSGGSTVTLLLAYVPSSSSTPFTSTMALPTPLVAGSNGTWCLEDGVFYDGLALQDVTFVGYVLP
jgi:hypothetical protein